MKQSLPPPFITGEKVYQGLFLILCASLASSLFLNAYPRKLFYLVSYTATIFILIKIKRREIIFNRDAIAVSVALFLIGAVRLVWGEAFSHSLFTDVTGNYRTGGKLFIISSVTAYFFIVWRNYLTTRVAFSGLIILLAGLCVTLAVALHEHMTTGDRVRLLTDSAGTVSYLITLLAFSSLFIAYRAVSGLSLRITLFCVIACLNTLLLVLTESRAGVLSLPFMYMAFFFLVHRKLVKFSLFPLGIMITVGFIMMPESVWNRLDSIQTEISSYQSNNDTSIGARFSIWKSGFQSIRWTFIGQSPDDRTLKARMFITNHERGNPEAFKNVQYHLHNDMLETLSLQGIAGGISVLIFYIVLIYVPVTRQSAGLALLPASLVIFGLTDTVLIQSLSVTVICLSLCISYALLGTVKAGGNR
ncbi:ligase [Erwinia typographi]|uniref:Ligase n=1 Tax=Erwinia typographi TaxID=371042 RepID=A0A0A3Z6Z8_9GAMM|nr:O-antigen ligase family protein [Erwinia typographi]KGT93494.1 ligase [Erwinia typographi]